MSKQDVLEFTLDLSSLNSIVSTRAKRKPAARVDPQPGYLADFDWSPEAVAEFERPMSRQQIKAKRLDLDNEISNGW